MSTDDDEDATDAVWKETSLDRRPPLPAVIDRTANAMAAAARAEIQARVWLAIERPRSLPEVRDKLLTMVKRPSFAERAVYRLPRGKVKDVNGKWVDNFIEGPSIHLAKAIRLAYTNMGTKDVVVAEDDDTRTVAIIAIDYESNTSEERTVVVRKTVERKGFKNSDGKWTAPDREVISSRTNSYGDQVFLCRATDDEVAEKQNSRASRERRTAILALVPADLVDDVVRAAKVVASSTVAKQREAEIARLKAAFAKISTTQAELAEYLGHAIDDATHDEIVGLGMLLNAIADGSATWRGTLRAAQEARAAEAADTEPEVTDAPAPRSGKGGAATRAAVDGALSRAKPDKEG